MLFYFLHNKLSLYSPGLCPREFLSTGKRYEHQVPGPGGAFIAGDPEINPLVVGRTPTAVVTMVCLALRRLLLLPWCASYITKLLFQVTSHYGNQATYL